MSASSQKLCRKGPDNRRGLRLFIIIMLGVAALSSVGAMYRSLQRGFMPQAFWYLTGGNNVQERFVYADVLPTAEADVFPDSVDGIGPVQQENPFFLTEELIIEPLFDETTLPGPSGDQDRDSNIHWWSHKIAQGETLSGIAEKYGVGVSLIKNSNDLANPDKLSLGGELLIPKGIDHKEAVVAELSRRKKEAEKQEKQADPFAISTYVVRTGDSLWGIASRYNLDINTLFGCNSLKDPDRLKPGTTLRIPNQDGILYKVKKKDTLARISKKYGVYVEAIAGANNIAASGSLTVGASLFLPGAKPITVVQRIGGSGGKGSASATSARGFQWPLRGRVTSPFGWRRDPFTKRRDFHTGIDIKGPRGRIIVAAKGGVVTYSGWMGGYGRVVVVKHGGGYTTLYAHCDRLLVRRGQKVSQGQRVARCGASGRATGPHLHFEVRHKNKPTNPRKALP